MSAASGTPPLELTDIQGNVLRGFRASHARHLALAVGAGGDGPGFIAALVSGHDDRSPQVSAADRWEEKPPYALNLGVTAEGLAALAVPDATIQQFSAAFVAGSAARSTIAEGSDDWTRVGIGDIGTSSPDTWILGGPSTPAVHLLASLYTDDRSTVELEARTAQLRAVADEHGITEVSCHDAVALPEGRVHFGYRDGISQPWIDGSPGPRPSDRQPAAGSGDFLLGAGHRNIYRGNFAGGIPSVLADNGTFSAFRILRQDVTAFEAFLDRAAERYEFDRELVAAKLVGRWRNGVPLTESHETDTPPNGVPPAPHNDYDYASTPDHPTYFDDTNGVRCPVGAHMRRLNPRSGLVMGLPHNHRIIRRGMPYGPPVSDTPDDVERGLIGHFICGDLEAQFEFIMRVWANQDISAAGLRGTRDPILGAQPDCGGKFTIRTTDRRDPVVLNDLPRLVDTRGSLYLFLPGINALRSLAAR